MVDILTYRHRIGCFNQIVRFRYGKMRHLVYKKEEYSALLQYYSKILMCFLLIYTTGVCYSEAIQVKDSSYDKSVRGIIIIK